MKKLVSLAACVALLVVVGCSQENSTTTSPATPAIDGSKYLLTAEPEGATDVIKLREEAQDQDEVVIVGRIGGEEFAVILPSTSTSEAMEFSERLHGAIGQAVLKYNDNAIRYTASIGLTEFESESEDSIEELLARADLALYQAKQDGRNRTATFNPQLTRAAAG